MICDTGDDRYDAEGYIVTNYFSVQYGDTVYVKNLEIADTLHSGLYEAEKKAIAGFVMTASGGAGFVKDIGQEGAWTVFTVDHANAAYLRLCGILNKEKEDVVINIYRDGAWLSNAE